MSTRFASGTYAKAVCDRCGLDKKYRELTSQFCKRRNIGIRVCRQCLDQENPQIYVADVLRAKGADAEALEHPRPDTLPVTNPVQKNWIDRLTMGAAVAPEETTYKNYYGGNL